MFIIRGFLPVEYSVKNNWFLRTFLKKEAIEKRIEFIKYEFDVVLLLNQLPKLLSAYNAGMSSNEYFLVMKDFFVQSCISLDEQPFSEDAFDSLPLSFVIQLSDEIRLNIMELFESLTKAMVC